MRTANVKHNNNTLNAINPLLDRRDSFALFNTQYGWTRHLVLPCSWIDGFTRSVRREYCYFPGGTTNIVHQINREAKFIANPMMSYLHVQKPRKNGVVHINNVHEQNVR